MDPSIPPHQLLQRQAVWLAPARARLLRRVHVARRRRILDLGCASGAVTAELVRRGGGPVVALDRHAESLGTEACACSGALRVCGNVSRLPLVDGAFDLVFCQFSLLWMDAASAAAEVRRVLTPGGVLVALEPDYGGLIEHPPRIAARPIWLAALRRAGADPEIGRRLPGLLSAAGFRVEVALLDRLMPPEPERFAFLRQLPLEPDEQTALAEIERQDALVAPQSRVAHLPLLLVTAVRP